MTEKELNEIEATVAQAAPGPWREHRVCCGYQFGERPGIDAGNMYASEIRNSRHAVCHNVATAVIRPDGVYECLDPNADPTAKFIARSRELVPALIAEVRRCWEDIDRLKQSQGYAPKPYEDPVWALSDLTPEV